MATVFDRTMAEVGLTQAQLRTLLSLCDQPCSPGELARRSMLERATVSLVAQRMVDLGWLERLPGPNRRTHRLALTASGRDALVLALPAANELARKALHFLTDNETQLLEVLLDKLENHLRSQWQ